MPSRLTFAIILATSAATAQWSVPIQHTNLNTASSEFDPSPTFDGLKLYFTSNRSVNFELFYATRSAPYQQFGPPTQIMELADPGTDAGPCVRIDDCEIFWYSSRAGGLGGTDVWRATRIAPSLPWGTPSNVTELNSASGELSASLTSDGLRIYFTRNSIVHTASRPSWFSPFSTPVPVPELTSSAEREPHISPDGLAIYFTSSRAGGLGGSDTWLATRLDPTLPFSNIVNLAVLNSSSADSSPRSRTTATRSSSAPRARDRGPTTSTARASRARRERHRRGQLDQDPPLLRPGQPEPRLRRRRGARRHAGHHPRGGLLPLNPDPLFAITIGGLPPVLTGYTGLLDANGLGSERSRSRATRSCSGSASSARSSSSTRWPRTASRRSATRTRCSCSRPPGSWFWATGPEIEPRRPRSG
jgi:hypothetical protein